ncbi:hypothetical protein WICPIJ_007727 [Wickerhamomyces pijperi]|uniref:Uncharacterized protein n=1 Tax=Wickerhamomyces pijperi TaxID=599730 RepID=A0A9P8Q166_WICPI|nr:hypothetical protein WICPIJ_007727 [Wickerhamomyces pijperi]
MEKVTSTSSDWLSLKANSANLEPGTDSAISSAEKDSNKEACKAAPLATNSSGFLNLVSKDGAAMTVDSGNKSAMLEANLGVLDKPPTNNTSSMSKTSKLAFLTTDSTKAGNWERTERHVTSKRNLLMEEWKSIPSAKASMEMVAEETLDRVFLARTEASFNLAMERGLDLALVWYFFLNSAAMWSAKAASKLSPFKEKS